MKIFLLLGCAIAVTFCLRAGDNVNLLLVNGAIWVPPSSSPFCPKTNPSSNKRSSRAPISRTWKKGSCLAAYAALLLSSSDSSTGTTEHSMNPLLASPVETRGSVCCWRERLRQLETFKQVNGHTRVPKRYKPNPSLGNWVNKQRQNYRNHKTGTKPSSLNAERIEALNQLGFCWDASSSSLTTPQYSNRNQSNNFVRNEMYLEAQSRANYEPSSSTSFHDEQDNSSQWWSQFQELKRAVDESMNDSTGAVTSTIHLAANRNSRMEKWLRIQRERFQASQLLPHQVQALQELNPDWNLSRRQWQWEYRFRELLAYVETHNGNGCVPISYRANRPLAHWVSNQRKQYNRMKQGKSSDMTLERLERLNAIDFVWNRWEYEFNKQQKQWEDSK
jgi:hypothetical protein